MTRAPVSRKLAVVVLWAFGEATVVPIMPDAIVVPLVLGAPGSWWRLTLAAMLGSTCGGALSYWLGRRGATRASVARLPLVRPAMVTATDRWLATEGSRGVVRQPLTGVPFKVFARLAGIRRLPLVPFLAYAVASRGVRMLLAGGGAALVGHRYGPFTRSGHLGLTAIWWLGFGLSLWRLVRRWEDPSPECGPVGVTAVAADNDRAAVG